nr:MAG TPA: hypothetical protein [Caudoviricetes sp.]
MLTPSLASTLRLTVLLQPAHRIFTPTKYS